MTISRQPADYFFMLWNDRIYLMHNKLMQKLLFPLLLLAGLIVLVLIYQILDLPTNEELVEIVKVYFKLYGYPVLFFSALIEAIPGINLYYPGSTIILLAAAFSKSGQLNIVGVVFLTTLAFMLAYLFNYWIGKRGIHRFFIRFGLSESLEKTRIKIEKHGNKWIWISFVHPNLGALTAVSFGILKISLNKFVPHSLAALILWNTFWGALSYFGSEKIVGLIVARWLF
jgi:membrane protein DedA with SNARE-associated domain